MEPSTADKKPVDIVATGAKLWFEYHCEESHKSCDAALWYRSHQIVEVLGFADFEPEALYMTQLQRADAGMPVAYRIRFKDGAEYTAMGDELLSSPDQFERPDPPQPQ